jgi:hypothetical protein
MEKSIFDSAARQEILSRIDSLKPEAKALWGKMNVRQGLHHMSLAFRNSLGELQTKSGRGGKLKKKIMKFFLLNVAPPKGKAETLPEFNTVNLGIDPQDFDTEKRNLRQYVERFAVSTTFAPESSGGGPFTKEDWGKLMYIHSDHHLKQFGV